jgi:hypothetical protein
MALEKSKLLLMVELMATSTVENFIPPIERITPKLIKQYVKTSKKAFARAGRIRRS